MTFTDGNVRLAGTLLLPDGEGSFPAMVIAQASGPENRGWASYRSWGVLLARHGVAALIYDKRGTGQSTGDYTTASLDDLARDALAGLASLRERTDIRRDRIGIAGHSQGGWIAPLAATMSRDVRFIMVTSASGLGPMDQSLYDNTNAMRAAGFSDADIEKAEGLRRRMYNGVRSGRLDSKLNDDLAAIASERWFKASQLPASIAEPPSPGERSFLLFKPVPVWRRVHVPVLAIWGGDDAQVPAEGSEHLIDDALHSAGNRKSEMRLLPGLGHNFLRTKPAVAHDFPRGTPELEPIIADWLSRRVRANPG